MRVQGKNNAGIGGCQGRPLGHQLIEGQSMQIADRCSLCTTYRMSNGRVFEEVEKQRR